MDTLQIGARTWGTLNISSKLAHNTIFSSYGTAETAAASIDTFDLLSVASFARPTEPLVDFAPPLRYSLAALAASAAGEAYVSHDEFL
jgi:hypothetical protein